MLNQPMVEKLHALRLRGMAEGLAQQQQDPQYRQLCFEERFALLVDPDELEQEGFRPEQTHLDSRKRPRRGGFSSKRSGPCRSSTTNPGRN